MSFLMHGFSIPLEDLSLKVHIQKRNLLIKTHTNLSSRVWFKAQPSYSPIFNKTFYHAMSLAGATKEKQQEQLK